MVFALRPWRHHGAIRNRQEAGRAPWIAWQERELWHEKGSGKEVGGVTNSEKRRGGVWEDTIPIGSAGGATSVTISIHSNKVQCWHLRRYPHSTAWCWCFPLYPLRSHPPHLFFCNVSSRIFLTPLFFGFLLALIPSSVFFGYMPCIPSLPVCSSWLDWSLDELTLRKWKRKATEDKEERNYGKEASPLDLSGRLTVIHHSTKGKVRRLH